MEEEAENTPERLRDLEVVERIQRNLAHDDGTTLLAVENLVHLLKTYSVVHDAIMDLLAPYELTLAQYNLLAILNNTPERHLPMSEIGERMSVTRTNITKLVDCLERSGLVRRANRPGDRRVVLAEMTERGVALMRDVVPHHYENMRHLWGGMGPIDCLQLTHLLLQLRRSVVNGLEAHRADCTDEAAADLPAESSLR